MFLNSSFCHIPPSTEGLYEPATIVIELPSWVRSDTPANANPEAYVHPVCIRQVDTALSSDGSHYTTASSCESSEYNYAGAMVVGVRHSGDGWRSSSIVLRGNDAGLLTEGTYEVRPVLTAGGLVKDSDVSSPAPAADFAVRFTLLSECNANGVPDYAEVVHQIEDQAWVDVWPMDGLIDICHPELCERDYTGDGDVNQDDINALAACINGDCSGLAAHADPDFNHDGNVDQDDVTALINAVAGGAARRA